MFSPLNRVQQQSSFLSKVGVPADGPMGPPYVYIYFNATWLPYVLGALQQLCQPGTWITASQAALESVLGEAQDLLAQIAAANGPQPPIFQVTSTGYFQVSTDGGLTWITVLPFVPSPAGEISTPVPIGANVIGNGEHVPIILNNLLGSAVKNQ